MVANGSVDPASLKGCGPRLVAPRTRVQKLLLPGCRLARENGELVATGGR
jgi:hypothetical protein